MGIKSEIEDKSRLNVPGPGQYSPTRKIVERSITHGFSFAGRTDSVDARASVLKATVPGPGNYSIESTLVSKKGSVFGSEQRPGLERKAGVTIPGPGAYKAGDSLARPAMPTYGYITRMQM